MKQLVMSLEYGRNDCQEVISLTQWRDPWNQQVLIGNQREEQ